MAGATLLTLIDDISTLLDDVALMSKLALKKTAGVVGDDLALNAQQVVGVDVTRELPVVWSVAKGSGLNKVILVPLALGISALAKWAVTPLLMIGGAYLCYEGFEKIIHKWLHDPAAEAEHHQQQLEGLAKPQVDMVALERDKIRGAVRTDFILSAEIIVIALGEIAKEPLLKQLAVLATVAVAMTVSVYGLVAVIIKLDDLGLMLTVRPGRSSFARTQRALGWTLLKTAPYLMRGLSIAGTAAMFLVGGGILVHGVEPLHHWVEELAHEFSGLAWLVELAANGLAGVAAGAVIVGIMTAVRAVTSPRSRHKHA